VDVRLDPLDECDFGAAEDGLALERALDWLALGEVLTDLVLAPLVVVRRFTRWVVLVLERPFD